MIRTLIIGILILCLVPGIAAEDEDEIEIFGLELEKILNLGSGILAVGNVGSAESAKRTMANAAETVDIAPSSRVDRRASHAPSTGTTPIP